MTVLVNSLSKAEVRDVTVIKRFPPVATPEDMDADVEAMIKQ